MIVRFAYLIDHVYLNEWDLMNIYDNWLFGPGKKKGLLYIYSYAEYW